MKSLEHQVYGGKIVRSLGDLYAVGGFLIRNRDPFALFVHREDLLECIPFLGEVEGEGFCVVAAEVDQGENTDEFVFGTLLGFVHQGEDAGIVLDENELVARLGDQLVEELLTAIIEQGLGIVLFQGHAHNDHRSAKAVVKACHGGTDEFAAEGVCLGKHLGAVIGHLDLEKLAAVSRGKQVGNCHVSSNTVGGVAVADDLTGAGVVHKGRFRDVLTDLYAEILSVAALTQLRGGVAVQEKRTREIFKHLFVGIEHCGATVPKGDV